MAVALEQFAVEYANPDPPNDVLASGASAGNLLISVAAARWGSSGPVSTFNLPTDYTSAFYINPMEAHTAECAYKVATGGETTTDWSVNGTYTSTAAFIAEFSGITSPTLDKSADAGSNTSSVSSIATGSTGTLGASSGLAFLVGLSRTGSGGGLSNDASMAEITDSTTTSFDMMCAWQEFAASTAYNVTVSQSGGASRMGAGIATFIASGGGGGTAPTMVQVSPLLIFGMT